MAKDLKNFIKNNSAKKSSADDIPKDIREKAAQYENKSEAELMSELSRSIAAGKENGSQRRSETNPHIRYLKPAVMCFRNATRIKVSRTTTTDAEMLIFNIKINKSMIFILFFFN